MGRGCSNLLISLIPVLWVPCQQDAGNKGGSKQLMTRAAVHNTIPSHTSTHAYTHTHSQNMSILNLKFSFHHHPLGRKVLVCKDKNWQLSPQARRPSKGSSKHCLLVFFYWSHTARANVDFSAAPISLSHSSLLEHEQSMSGCLLLFSRKRETSGLYCLS